MGIRLTTEAGTLAEMGLSIPVLILAVLLVVLAVILVLQILRIGKLEQKLKSFTKGRNVTSLENEIVGLFKDNRQLTKHASRSKKEIEEIRHRMLTHVSKVGIVKYDAFHQMGGQLSFALCMLDEEDNGFVLNSVQSADGCYSYIKEIIAGQSSIELGREEEQAFLRAMEAA
ncbi:MAG: DUF4446 family protein [Lachnospiraceae bacterium]|nr:DUF4446 family protein [Lachnospiraceae bacterium]